LSRCAINDVRIRANEEFVGEYLIQTGIWEGQVFGLYFHVVRIKMDRTGYYAYGHGHEGGRRTTHSVNVCLEGTCCWSRLLWLML
jgi:hypothetical protein